MGESEDKNPNQKTSTPPPGREIANARLFADEIVFSDTEKILFEEDLKENSGDRHKPLMEENPEERYTPRKKLNQGGMKAIWEVDDHRTARKVAMAMIQDSRIASSDDIDSFLYEARLTANLQHPNIIPIYDIALDKNGNPYFTMKALKGETLGEIIQKLRNNDCEYAVKYTRTRLLGIFIKVCNAIEYAHTKGVIHLDLKPSNVIVGEFGDVHVLDWGLSTLMTHLNEFENTPFSWHSIDDVALEDGQTLTRYLEGSAKRRKVVGGTPGYMSPEQAQGSPADIDIRTDVYMLGALLYELLTYQSPITGETVKEVLQKTVRGSIPPPDKRAPEHRIPSALTAIVMKAMQTDQSGRYANVASMIHDIHKYQEGYATTAENPTFLTHLALLVQRHKMAVGLITASLLIIGLVITKSFISIKKSEQVAVSALASLQERNDYIAAVAQQVAPDYLNLMEREEKSFLFVEAEQDLDRGLAFDPSLTEGWIRKAQILLCRQEFTEAWKILQEHTVSSTQNALQTRQLAEKYRNRSDLPDEEIPSLVNDFIRHGLKERLPRLFHHLNQQSFDPATRFPAMSSALKLLNPKQMTLYFDWQMTGSDQWRIDISNNPDLEDISPLCGLPISELNAANIGVPDLTLLTESGLLRLSLSGIPMNHLFDLDQMVNLEELNISGTRIRNISNIVKYPDLKILNISRIEELAISPQLIWCRNLQLLTVAEKFRQDPTLQALSRRGVIIIYTDE